MEIEYDQDLITDFLGEYADAQIEIEAILQHWQGATQQELLTPLYRAVHSIKSNFCMLGLESLVDSIHTLEDILSQIRENRYPFTPELPILVSQIIEQCKELSKQTLQGIDKKDDIQCLTQTLQPLVQAPSEQQYTQLLAAAIYNLDAMGAYGDDYDGQAVIDFLQQREQAILHQPNHENKSSSVKEDLEYFCQLIIQIESFFPFWKNRSHKILKLVNKMNQSFGYPINPEQLQAAVYIHDLGMTFMPPQKLYVNRRFSKEEKQWLNSHCYLGHRWLKMCSGWELASMMVYQHHERFDGTGYPNQLSANQICDGAKLLAIADTYTAILGQEKKGQQRKPIMFAIAEINQGAGTQFDPDWVNIFNEVIRKLR